PSSADTGSAPGRVDSPPTSTSAAPSRCSPRPCTIASEGLKNLPPSEKLSGVTFSTPITAGRGKRSSRGTRGEVTRRSLGDRGRGPASGSAPSRGVDSRGDEHRTPEFGPARTAPWNPVRDPPLHRHPELLRVVLGLQDAGRGQEPLGPGTRGRSRPRRLDPDQPRQRVRHPVR